MTWRTVPLHKVASLESGFGFPRENQGDENQEFPFFRVSDMNIPGNEVFMENHSNTVSAATLKELGARAFPAGTVIFPKIGAAIATEKKRILTKPSTYDNNVMGAVPKDAVTPRFLYYWFLRLKLTDLANPGHVPSIRKSVMEEIPFPVVAPSEQSRIVKLLDEADHLRRLRREADVKAARILSALFLKMFGDPVTNPKGWPSDRTLGDVSEIVSGITKGRIAKDATREVPYLAVVNVQDRSLRLDVVKHIEATESEIAKYKLQVNDLLLTEGGDPDKLGRGVLWDGSLEECIHQNHVFRVRLTTGDIHPVYLNWYVGSERGKRYFASQAKQTTGIASINMRQLRALPLLLPPMALQRRFADNVMTTAQHKTRLNRSVSGLDQLLTALQHSAFSAAT